MYVNFYYFVTQYPLSQQSTQHLTLNLSGGNSKTSNVPSAMTLKTEDLAPRVSAEMIKTDPAEFKKEFTLVQPKKERIHLILPE